MLPLLVFILPYTQHFCTFMKRLNERHIDLAYSQVFSCSCAIPLFYCYFPGVATFYREKEIFTSQMTLISYRPGDTVYLNVGMFLATRFPFTLVLLLGTHLNIYFKAALNQFNVMYSNVFCLLLLLLLLARHHCILNVHSLLPTEFQQFVLRL